MICRSLAARLTSTHILSNSVDKRHKYPSLRVSSFQYRSSSLTTHVNLISSIQIVPILQISYRITVLSLIFTPVIVTYPIHLLHTFFVSSNQSWWIRLLVCQLERAGPLFIKLGQWASTRRDLFSDETCDALTKLQSKIIPHSMEHTRRTIQAMYGKQFESIFSEFNVDPVGVGAVAQVYRAALTDKFGDKTDVAVKVLHPGVREQVALDMQLIQAIGSLLEFVPGMVYLGPSKEVDTFCAMMTRQLDLRVEANNLVKFRRNFSDVVCVSFPKPITELCTSDVLVEAFHEGLLLSDWLARGESIYDTEIAKVGLNAFMKMLLSDNFGHADLHAGNVILSFHKRHPASLFRAETVADITVEEMTMLKACTTRNEWIDKLSEFKTQGYEPKLILIDVGLISVLNDKSQANLVDVVRAALQFDGYKIADLIISRSTHPHLVINAEQGTLNYFCVIL